MSRIGKQPIEIPDGVEVGVADSVVIVKGPRGELSQRVHPLMRVVSVPPLARLSRISMWRAAPWSGDYV